MRKLGLATLSAGLIACAVPSLSQAQLRITPVTWNVVGLDHNKPLEEGPNVFPTAVRVENIGSTTVNNVVGTFVWDETPSPNYLTLDAATTVNSYTVDSLAPGAAAEFWFNLNINRNGLGSSRDFHIEAYCNEFPTAVRTPINREIYVQGLQSQARNDVLSFTGPSQVFIGEIYQYVMNSTTPQGGYEEITTWSNFPPNQFRYMSVLYQADTPTGFTSNQIYHDGCGWVNDTSSPSYNSCSLSQQASVKVGNNQLVTTTVMPRANGTAAINHLIYDKSGNSWHYNTDSTSFITVLEVFDPAQFGDLCWNDVNFNGVYDAGIDEGISGIRINVTSAGPDGILGNADDVAQGFVTSGLDGSYEKRLLLPGRYRATVDLSTVPPGMQLLANGGPPAGRNTKDTELVQGETDLDLDFGFFEPTLDVDLDYFRALAYSGDERVRLVWQTLSEIDTAGFNVYRAEETESRNYLIGERINENMIAAKGSEIAGAFYDYYDPAPVANSRESRSYFLQDVNMGGGSQYNGPITLEWNAVFSGPGSSVNDWHMF